MTAVNSSDDRTADIASPCPLTEEFTGLVPHALVRAERRGAARDLEGQVPPASLPELTHRLARERLLQRLRGRRVGAPALALQGERTVRGT